MREVLLEGKEANPEIIHLVQQVPHREYWGGFLLNPLKEFPDGETALDPELQQTTRA